MIHLYFAYVALTKTAVKRGFEIPLLCVILQCVDQKYRVSVWMDLNLPESVINLYRPHPHSSGMNVLLTNTLSFTATEVRLEQANQ